LYERSVAMMLTASAGLMGAALVAMAAIQRVIEPPSEAISQKD
jgi:hypothetical protein